MRTPVTPARRYAICPNLPPIHIPRIRSTREALGANPPQYLRWRGVSKTTNAQWLADIALGQIKALRHAATPRNYEIWYAYASGYHPLNQQVNAILKAKGTIADTDLVQTYEKHLSPTRLTERIDLVGSRVKGEIDQVMAMIDAAAGSASSYTESLAGATEQIVRSKDRDGLRTIVEIVQTTKTMEISTVNLKKD